MERAAELHAWCRNPATVLISTTFVQSGAARSTAYAPARPAGCLVDVSACPNHPNVGAMGPFADAWDNSNRDANRCMARARDYHAWCGLPWGVPVTARYFSQWGNSVVEFNRTVYAGF